MNMAGLWRTQASRLSAVTRLQPFDTSTPEGRSKERYRRIALTVTSGVLLRILTTAVTLAITPVFLSYLGKDLFGLWSALATATVWLSLFDFGLTAGLVNAISEAHGIGDRAAAARYVSTACVLLTAIALGLGVVFAFLVPVVPWHKVLAAEEVLSRNLVRWSVVAAVGSFLVGMPLGVVRQIYSGYQKSYMANLFGVLGLVTTVGAAWMVVAFRFNLPIMIVVFAAAGLIVALANLVFLTTVEMPWLRIRRACVSWEAFNRLGRSAAPLGLLQLGGLMVNQSQPLILAHVANLDAVADFAIVLRVIQVFSTLVLLTTSAFVPPYREAFERGDREWVRVGFKRMLALRMTLAALFVASLIGFGDRLIHLWLSRTDVHFGSGVWVALAIYILASTWVTAYTDLLTILDRIWIQVGFVLINGIVTMALTFWFWPRYGLAGVILAGGLTTAVAWTWLLPIVSRLTLSTIARGPVRTRW